MSKKYEGLAQEIIKKVGGENNINDVYHCQTRLRFKLIDASLANPEEVENIDGVAKVIMNAGVFQVVIGTHVKDVFEEVSKYVKPKETQVETNEKKSPLGVVVDFVTGAFGPIIPALSGAGMVKALLALLTVFNLISTGSQTYYILNFFADAVFYFLPMYLAFCVAQKLRCNPILAAAVAGIMMHPKWIDMVAVKEAVHLFEVIPFTLTSYTGTVIPIILVILVQSYVEKKLEKWIPKSVELVFVPMLTFLIMGTLALSVLGPIGSILGGFLATFFNFLSVNVSWAPPLLIGGFLPIMVMFGLHNGVAPLGVMQMADVGYDSIFGPGCVCSNIAQATAALVVSLRTKDKKLKQIATSGSITAYMGITEPVLYGVNLPKKYPLIAAMIGGGCGGLFAGLTRTHRFATGSSGLPAVLLYIGDGTMQYFYNIIIALVITVVVTAVVTYILSLKFEKPELEVKNELNQGVIQAEANQDCVVLNPVKGEVFSLSEAKDEAFASGVLGKGVVVEPSEGKIVAPFAGKIVTLFPTKHAIGIVSNDGAEILIHVGINTVELNGKYFTDFVKQGDMVKAGQKLVEFNIEGIKKAGYQAQVVILVTNTDKYASVNALANGNRDEMTKLLELKKGENNVL